MSDAPLRSMSYTTARWLLIAVGVLILVGIAGVMFVRRVDPVEVAATLMFLPVFFAFVVWGMRGGLITGLAAAIAYAAMRMPAIQAVGVERFSGLIAARALGYLGFGGVGGWASDQIEASIVKLDLYDHIDDQTKLHNSRSMFETIDRETSRASRYSEVFSVVTVSLTLPEMSQRSRSALMKELGRVIESGVRSVDHAGRVVDRSVDLLMVVLPETGSAGAGTFAAKLGALVDSVLQQHSVEGGAREVSIATYPDEQQAMTELTDRLRHIVRHDFPETVTARA